MTRPLGTLIAVGGAEDKEDDMVILRRCIEEARKVGSVDRIEVIAAASREPREAARPYLRAFEEMGMRKVDYMELQSNESVEERRTLERLEEADIVYFTGGDQVRLAERFRGTRALDVIRERYMQGAVIAGTSAGAAAMSKVMLARGAVEEGLTKGNIKTATGLGLLPQTIIDTHFVQRGRFGRLLEAVAHEPDLLGFGISEDTAMVLREGRRVEVIGSDNLIVVDGREIKHTDAHHAERGEAMSVERLILHALAEGDSFDLETRQFKAPQRTPPPRKTESAESTPR